MKKYYLLIILLMGSVGCLSGQEKQVIIYFESNKDEIPDSSLLSIIKTLHSMKVEKVLIEGHCDSIGSFAYNKTLSIKRAKVIQKLLVENGIDKANIKSCVGYGYEKPQASNLSGEGRQLNRRAVTHFYFNDSIPAIASKTSTVFKAADFKTGATITLHHLLFQGGRHYLMPQSFTVLEDLLDILKKNTTVQIEIQGHVCCTTVETDGHDFDLGTDNLSVTRAKMIYDYLIKGGIDPQRLRYRGFGGSKKLTEDESTEELKRINRRVELKVIQD